MDRVEYMQMLVCMHVRLSDELCRFSAFGMRNVSNYLVNVPNTESRSLSTEHIANCTIFYLQLFKCHFIHRTAMSLRVVQSTSLYT